MCRPGLQEVCRATVFATPLHRGLRGQVARMVLAPIEQCESQGGIFLCYTKSHISPPPVNAGLWPFVATALNIFLPSPKIARGVLFAWETTTYPYGAFTGRFRGAFAFSLSHCQGLAYGPPGRLGRLFANDYLYKSFLFYFFIYAHSRKNAPNAPLGLKRWFLWKLRIFQKRPESAPSGRLGRL